MQETGILIVGTVPPPTGGVTVHVSRLLEHLKKLNINHDFADVRKDNIFFTVSRLISAQIVHLHVSNPWFRFFIITFLKALGKKVLFTFHGNVGRYGTLKNFVDRVSFGMADIPIVLNSGSLERAIRVNKASRLISSFIPPLAEKTLPFKIANQIEEIRSKYATIYAANASYLQYDKDGCEVYQIIPLVALFKEAEDKALIISDPSGMYAAYFVKNEIVVPPNVLLISGEHSFFEVLRMAHVFLRITTTDGDSLSVKEALYLNKIVIASSVVERPRQTILTSLNPARIREAIMLHSNMDTTSTEPVDNGLPAIVELYYSFTQ
ncbi:hypothetical protein EDD80_11732 [Anseongella ginsenosidimutans]|uniref:Glycosyltransferase involved in cell wall biosynthesis n=1 Tax=Anseongella ginsenosidimutans TaxID=496056 RepID=A0A4V2UT98_9SPHI|nr:glycosyltransferase [Anseongella ginsenosidimutans]QEC52117.1 glycosyltransferase [Anseongella ginsenosidimutans]TCS84854.1 hypothetical protein EDD80_11732 [Anseongella ginsenosidimutans]